MSAIGPTGDTGGGLTSSVVRRSISRLGDVLRDRR